MPSPNTEHHAKHSSKQQGWARLFLALGYSWDGLCAVWKTEAAFRQEIALGLILLPLIGILDFTLITRIILISLYGMVLVTELLNSAIEALSDLCSPEYHPLVKYAKDAGSAAVLIVLLTNQLVWIFAIYELCNSAK